MTKMVVAKSAINSDFFCKIFIVGLEANFCLIKIIKLFCEIALWDMSIKKDKKITYK